MLFFDQFITEVIGTGIVIILVIGLRILTSKVIRKYAKTSEIIEHRTRLVIKYIHLLINILALFSIIIIWGVQTKDIIVAISSVTTVVGVAMFANWSILSNITSGIILFFAFPFKIGDFIRIHDKDFTVEAEIEDIRAFHVYLKAKNGEKVIYPNNLLLQKGVSIIKNPYQEKEFVD
jgi:small-conductance mechanosensitive channel